MDLVQVTNGFSQLLPHRAFILGTDGQPTSVTTSIESMADLTDNVRVSNPVHSTPSYPEQAILPDGSPGNQFMMLEFTQALDLESVLSNSGAQIPNNSLAGSVVFEQVDPATGATSIIKGRVFLDGQTYGGSAVGSPPVLEFQRWIAEDGSAVGFDTDEDEVDDYFPGLGFPGTEATFAGAATLLNPRTMVFVPDADDNLSTHETFPSGVTIHVRIQTSVKNTELRNLARTAFASTTVGLDTFSPEVRISVAPQSTPEIFPGNGATDVDPLTSVQVNFSEPVQPWSVGNLPIYSAPGLSSAIAIQFGPETQRVTVPFSVLPVSYFDLSQFMLTPVYNFPGEGPDAASCGTFNRIDINVSSGQVADLPGNLNTLPTSTFFLTGEGPGLSNIPVSPDTIYVVRGGATPGVSVVDLNGFGQSTGNPVYDPSNQVFIEGQSMFAYNPNVALQGSAIRPALAVGSCTVDGGSSGVFTLSRDSSLSDLLIRDPVLLTPGDMMLGQALDSSFNNAPAPFGCQAGGGNLCVTDGRKRTRLVVGGANSLLPAYPPLINPTNNAELQNQQGAPNVISFAPHPNPPPLMFPPLCVSPFIGGQEPTSVYTSQPLPPAAPPNGLGLTNRLVPGANPLGNPNNGLPPSNMLSKEQNSFFVGPHAPQPNESLCFNYMIRQQVGQFLYILDRARNELVVFNSNTMRVIERIEMPDPTTLAISPNLDYMAITNQSVGLVSFVDINPASATFHQIVANTVVGNAPRGIAWEPGNEDILVCNEGDSTVSIISAFSLQVRKVLSSQLNQPFELAITGRQAGYGFSRNVYFAYIMNRNGRLALFESGPNGVNGWGFDDIIGAAPMSFQNPKAIQPDYINAFSGVWIVHEGPIDPFTGEEGQTGIPAVSNLKIESGIFGQLPLNVSSLTIPQFRDMSLAVSISIGGDTLSGVPVDVAFDNQRNFGGLQTFFTNFSAGVPSPVNGKSLIRSVGGALTNTCEPNYMFVAIPSPTFGSEGVLDVIDVSGGFNRVDTSSFRAEVNSIACTNASGLMDYWRQ
jgi:hypothetical protein